MTDVALKWNNALGCADLVRAGADLLLDYGMETALIISLFTWRRANDDDPLPVRGMDRKGWWGDSFSPIANDKIGSRRWLLQRAKALPTVFAEVEAYDRELLQWLIDDGVVASIALTYSSPAKGWVSTVVGLPRPGGPDRYRFDYLWSAV